MTEKGYIQIYTGNGKGKTTAALGLAVRAAGAGLRSYIVQFMKEYPYSEQGALPRFGDLIKCEQYGGDQFVLEKRPPGKSDLKTARLALQRAEKAVTGGEFDIVILDEAGPAIYFGLLTGDDFLNLIKNKPEKTELILTGRYIPEELIEAADLVTEMKEVKHYYTKGVTSRKGIDS